MDNFLVTITGPSGSGKTTLVRELLNRDSRFCELVSTTSREPRPGEEDGVDYYFVPLKAFEDRDRFAELVTFQGNMYGITHEEIKSKTTDGKIPVIIVEPNGKDQLDEMYIVFGVYLDVSSNILAERLLSRFHNKVLANQVTTEEKLVYEAARIHNCLIEEVFWEDEGNFDLTLDNSSRDDQNIPLLVTKLIEKVDEELEDLEEEGYD